MGWGVLETNSSQFCFQVNADRREAQVPGVLCKKVHKECRSVRSDTRSNLRFIVFAPSSGNGFGFILSAAARRQFSDLRHLITIPKFPVYFRIYVQMDIRGHISRWSDHSNAADIGWSVSLPTIFFIAL